MSLKRWGARRDKTEAAIVEAISAIGARCLPLDKIDLLVLYRGRLFIFECKSTRGKVQTMREKTQRQKDLEQDGWPLHFVSDPQQAIAILTEDKS